MISESEYRLGRTCLTKILHKRAGLPRNDTGNSFGRWMQSEAGKVRALAMALFPGAINASGNVEDTARLVPCNSSIANACFEGAEISSRVDIWVREERLIRLHSIVPKMFDLRRHELGLELHSQAGNLRGEWREHLEIIALRAATVRELFPGHRVISKMVVPCRGAAAEIERLHSHFGEQAGEWIITDPAVSAEAVRLLHVIDVTRDTAILEAQSTIKVSSMVQFLSNPGRAELKYRCKKCEFRVPKELSGFDACWGPLARVTPHMFDLAYMYFVQESGHPVADRLAREGRVSVWDIPEERIVGDYADRQRLQLEGTRCGQEIVRPGLMEEMGTAIFPLHFLDIETIRSLLPVHLGSTVGGLTLFQFSVHRLDSTKGDLEHIAWLNDEPSDPNLRFLAALRAALGDVGSVLVWTHYEEQSFHELLAELLGVGAAGPDIEWLKRLLFSGRILDMHELCFLYYWHPGMVGRTSIKAVLPAVWSTDTKIKFSPPFSRWAPEMDPYSTLAAAGKVGDGVQAMESYLSLIAALAENAFQPRAELLEYCGWDTEAMVYLWKYWLNTSKGNTSGRAQQRPDSALA